MRERDDKIKTVEELLEAGLIQMANKEEELKVKSPVLSSCGEIEIKWSCAKRMLERLKCSLRLFPLSRRCFWRQD